MHSTTYDKKIFSPGILFRDLGFLILNRSFGRHRWGNEAYAAEELVAELGAAFLCADLQITPAVRKAHAAYIGNWLTVLRNDKRAIFTAASYAQKAADYLHSLQPQQIAR